MEVTTTTKDWTIIKTKIFTAKLNFYSLLVIFFNNKTSAIDNQNIVFSIYSETHNIPLTENWSKFEATIQDMVYGGQYSKDITSTVSDKLAADTKTSIFAGDLKSGILKNNIPAIESLLKHVLLRILNDDSLEINCALEQITNAELAEGRVRAKNTLENSDVNAQELLPTPPDYRFVNAKLILAPIDGKLVTELQVGDTLMLNLIVTSMAENTIIDKLKLRKPDGTAKPVPARIVKIQPYKKGFQFLLNLTENYYTKIIEEERILVKMSPVKLPEASSTSDKRKVSTAKKTTRGSEKTGFSWATVAIIAALGIAILYMAFIGG